MHKKVHAGHKQLIRCIVSCCPQLQKHQNQVTIALWAGLAPVAGLGWLASWLRLRYFSLTVAQKFK